MGIENSSHKREKIDPTRRGFLNGMGAFAAVTALGIHTTARSESGDTVDAGTFADRHIAAKELREHGITAYQRGAYKAGISEPLARGLYPFGYGGDFLEDARKFMGGLTAGMVMDKNEARAKELKAIQDEQKRSDPNYMPSGSPDNDYNAFVARLDAWRMYLGMPQEYGTFGVSEYQPAESKDDKYYYKLNRFQEHLLWWGTLWAERPQYAGKKPVQVLLDFIENGYVKQDFAHTTKRELSDDLEGVMGRYILSKGDDERGQYISYWDRWDLDGSTEGASGLIGKPYEIYDRLYYDPRTFEVVQPRQQ